MTISCTKKGLSYNKIVKTIVSSNYCFYNSLLRPKSLSMPYSSGMSFGQLPYCCKIGAKNTTAQKIVFCKYDCIKVHIKSPAVEIFCSIRRA